MIVSVRLAVMRQTILIAWALPPAHQQMMVSAPLGALSKMMSIVSGPAIMSPRMGIAQLRALQTTTLIAVRAYALKPPLLAAAAMLTLNAGIVFPLIQIVILPVLAPGVMGSVLRHVIFQLIWIARRQNVSLITIVR